MKPDYKLVAKTRYIHLVSELADEIWHEVYQKLYPKKQLDAVLDALQSPEAIEAEIDAGMNYFVVLLAFNFLLNICINPPFVFLTYILSESGIDTAKLGLAENHIKTFLLAMTRLGYRREEILDLLRQETTKEGITDGSSGM